MKHLKYFDDYVLNEDSQQPTSVEVEIPKYGKVTLNYKYLNTKERIAEKPVINKFASKKLAERGPDLINKAVMAKKTEQLNITIDSERLEYTWRYISENIDKVLADKKIEIKGVILADNIKTEITNGVTNVVFNFTFKDKDSTQNTDPSGKTTKKILAGKIEEGREERVIVKKKQVVLVTDADMIKNEPKSENRLEVVNNSITLAAQGYTNHEGTYWYIKPQSYIWLDYETNQDISNFMIANKARFNMSDLYKKFGIDPTTKKVVGQINPNVQLKS